MKICRLLRAQSRAVAAEIRKATWSRAWGFYVISSSWVLGCEQESCKPIRSCFVVLRLWCSTPILVWSIYFSSSWYFIFHDTFRTSKHEDLNIINGQLMKLDQRCFTVCGYPRCKSLGAVQYILHFLLFTKHGQTTQASMQDLVCQLAKLAHRYHDSKIERWARKSVNCFEALVMKMVNWKYIYLVFFCTARKKYLSHTFSNCPYSRYSQPVGNGLAERTSRSSAPWKNLASHGIKHIPSDHVFNWGEIEIYLPQISWVYLF